MIPILLAALGTAWLEPPIAQPPNPLRLYVYSRDSDAGFRDDLLDVFRRELGKSLESSTELAYQGADADVRVQFLGQGELTVELGAEGEPARYSWRGDERAPRMWAIVRSGHFSKEFSIEGAGARHMSRLARTIGDWIQVNSAALRGRRRGAIPMGLRPSAYARGGRGAPTRAKLLPVRVCGLTLS